MGVAMVSFSQDESVVERFLRLPYANVCTDGLLGGRPHPRAYGTYPRILGRYVREKKVTTLEEAVRKMTSQAAIRVGLTDRGLVRPGMMADVVVFDPATVKDTATFEKPHQYAVGVSAVVVNGQVALENSKMTGVRGGVAIKLNAQ